MTKRRVEHARLNSLMTRMRESGFSVETLDMIDRAVHERIVADRQNAMANLIQALGVAGPEVDKQPRPRRGQCGWQWVGDDDGQWHRCDDKHGHPGLHTEYGQTYVEAQ